MTDKKINKLNSNDINKFKEEYLNSKGPSGENIHSEKTNEKIKQDKDFLYQNVKSE